MKKIQDLSRYDSHTYYNVVVNNPITNPISIPATFTETRTSPIIDNPSLYHFDIERFSVPSTAIPLFIFQDNFYYVTLKYNTDTYTQPVVFYPVILTNPESRSVFEYQHFIYMINNALQAAYTAANTAHPGVCPSAPLMIFDAPTQLFSILADKNYDPAVVSPTFEIYFNIPLFNRFRSFFATFDSSTDPFLNYHILVLNLGSNTNYTVGTTTYYQMQQEVISTGCLSDLKSIVFTSANIPIKSEYIPSTNGISTDAFRKILIDFEPLLSGNTTSNVGSIEYQYYLQGPRRLLDMQSNTPIRTIDVQVYWEDNNQNLTQILLPPGSCLTIKMLFSLKAKEVITV